VDIEQAVLRVQAAYPRIYLACHSRHQNARTTSQKLSQRDASLLAHLCEDHAVSQSDLARHMGVAKSTLSEALSGLEALGLAARHTNSSDGRGTLILRTPAGTRAMSDGSVLESARLAELLELLTSDERRRAVEGLELIAGASRQLQERTN
jgi:DNA-binding MarR family transcriptional regulator